MPNTPFWVRTSFRKFFPSMALHEVMKVGIPCMGTSPRRACTPINQSESKSMPINVIGFAHCLILKDGVVQAIKDPSHDSEPQAASKTASNLCVLLAISTQVLVTLQLHLRHAYKSSAVFRENRKAVYFFSKCDKTKDSLKI